MKVLLDINIMMDLLDNERPNAKLSEKLAVLCQAGLIDAFMATFSFSTLVYLLRKRFTLAEMKEIWSIWKGFVTFEGVSSKDLERGFEMSFADYEDALQAIVAEKVGARYIVTWNVRDYENSPVKAITPRRFFEEIMVGAKV